ncbi:unnamed protein product, partial [Rotaria magnacalcarata]
MIDHFGSHEDGSSDVYKRRKQITQTTTATTTNASIYNYDSDDESMSEPDRADIPEELEDDTIDEKAEN